MTIRYCDHCGKKLDHLADESLMSSEGVRDDVGALLDAESTTMYHANLMLCKPCYNDYWEQRRTFDIDYFGGWRKVLDGKV